MSEHDPTEIVTITVTLTVEEAWALHNSGTGEATVRAKRKLLDALNHQTRREA